MKIPVLKKDDKYYIELPDYLANSENVEIFLLRDGYYLLTAPLGEIKKPTIASVSMPKTAISEEEKAVLRKLLTIKFEKRIPKLVEKLFNPKELVVLSALITKGYVNVLSRKYPEGVYGIKESIYPVLRQNAEVQRPQEKAQAAVQQKPENNQPRQTEFMVINDARTAQDFSERYKKQLRSGELIGTRGFDGKFYVVSRNYYDGISPLIRKVLEKDSDAATIAKILNANIDAVKAVLTIMADKGELIEKKKGIFSLV